MVDEQPNELRRWDKLSVTGREQSHKAEQISTSPALRSPGEAARPLFPPVDTVSTINGTNLDLFVLFPVPA